MLFINSSVRKCCYIAYMTTFFSAFASEGLFNNYDFVDYLSERFAFNFFVGGASEITQRAEFASISYDITTDMSLIVGSSVVDPRYFHFFDLSIHNPWTIWSLQSSIELGFGQYADAESIKRRLSHSISFDYPLDPIFSLQLVYKRFATMPYTYKSVDHLIALGLGLRI